jgi:hypothetical protein
VGLHRVTLILLAAIYETQCDVWPSREAHLTVSRVIIRGSVISIMSGLSKIFNKFFKLSLLRDLESNCEDFALC